MHAAPVVTPLAPAAPVPVPRPKGSRATAADVTVQVSSTPTSAQLMFDNDPTLVCRTPCAIVLPPGRHTAKATSPDYRDELRVFQVAKLPLSFELKLVALRGVVRITSEPAGLPVMVNGQSIEQRTPAQLSLPVGRYLISVVSNNQRMDQNVTVTDGVWTAVAFK